MGLGCFADYRLGCSNKVLCGSSLARCRRIAVAPNNGEQQVTDDALTAYFVTGLVLMPVMEMEATGKFNIE